MTNHYLLASRRRYTARQAARQARLRVLIRLTFIVGGGIIGTVLGLYISQFLKG